jgi:tetratricopeptide (TPR) repeat protein
MPFCRMLVKSMVSRNGAPGYDREPVGTSSEGRPIPPQAALLTLGAGPCLTSGLFIGDFEMMPKGTPFFSFFVLTGMFCIPWMHVASAATCKNPRVSYTTEVINADEWKAKQEARLAKEFDKGIKELTKIEGQFDKLCEYGHNKGTPRWERIIGEMTEINRSCGDVIIRAALFSHKMEFVDYKRFVAADCKTAEALSRAPQTAADYVARGKAFIEKHDSNRALADFSEAIRLDANLATAFYHRGGILNGKGDAKGAISDILEAIRLDPKTGGSDFFASGESDQKIAGLLSVADDAIAEDASFAGAFNLRSVQLYFRGDNDGTISAATEAIRLNSSDPSPLNNRANARLKKGDIDGAIEDLDEAILLNPKAASFFRNRGNAYLQKGELDHALSDLNQAIRLDPKHQPAFVFRGQVYEKMGQRDKAMSDYKTALFLDESNFSSVGLDAYLTAGQRLTALLKDDKASK